MTISRPEVALGPAVNPSTPSLFARIRWLGGPFFGRTTKISPFRTVDWRWPSKGEGRPRKIRSRQARTTSWRERKVETVHYFISRTTNSRTIYRTLHRKKLWQRGLHNRLPSQTYLNHCFLRSVSSRVSLQTRWMSQNRRYQSRYRSSDSQDQERIKSHLWGNNWDWMPDSTFWTPRRKSSQARWIVLQLREETYPLARLQTPLPQYSKETMRDKTRKAQKICSQNHPPTI